jgi:hypothetical protein
MLFILLGRTHMLVIVYQARVFSEFYKLLVSMYYAIISYM